MAATITSVLAVSFRSAGPIASGWITVAFSRDWPFLIDVPAGTRDAGRAPMSAGSDPASAGRPHARPLLLMTTGLATLVIVLGEVRTGRDLRAGARPARLSEACSGKVGNLENRDFYKRFRPFTMIRISGATLWIRAMKRVVGLRNLAARRATPCRTAALLHLSGACPARDKSRVRPIFSGDRSRPSGACSAREGREAGRGGKRGRRKGRAYVGSFPSKRLRHMRNSCFFACKSPAAAPRRIVIGRRRSLSSRPRPENATRGRSRRRSADQSHLGRSASDRGLPFDVDQSMEKGSSATCSCPSWSHFVLGSASGPASALSGCYEPPSFVSEVKVEAMGL